MLIKYSLFILITILGIISNLILPFLINNKMHKFLLKILVKNYFNTKTCLKDDLNLKNNYGNIIIANHYNIIDYYLISSIIKNDTYVILKHDLFNEIINNKFISNILINIVKSINLISYKREDKTDGLKVKNKILKLIKKNKNVLVFAEGTSTKNGIPKNFKNGIFKLASENKIPIIPITLKYQKDIGLNIGDKFNPKNLFNNQVDVIIHDEIISSEWKYLKEKTFNTIVNCSK